MNWWDLKACIYRWVRKPWPLSAVLKREEAAIRGLLNQCSRQQGLLIDLGCGTGQSTGLVDRRFEIIAVDYSLAMLRHNVHARGRRLVADAQRLAIKPGVADVILCVGLSEYIRDISRLSAEMKAALKINGMLVLTSSPPNLFGLARNITGSRLFFRNADKVCKVLGKTGFSLIQHVHLFTMDVYLFSNSGNV